ncbi:uncharacterized protein LOC135398567 [Ornithodoros turicata]|uniref:uncharacterized protein LOC135398567 n=1 Tax=Ornithodoros turicata TaxID=34597 RepID=UPI00313A0A9E
MSLFNWPRATPDELHALTADYLKTELDRRGLETTGSKDEIVERLHRAIESERTHQVDTTDIPQVSTLPNTASSQPSTDTTALLAACIQQNAELIQMLQGSGRQQPMQVATLPDLSASIPTFEDSRNASSKRWVEELEKTQQLAAWQDSTVRAIAISKLRGTAKNWHLAAGHKFRTWEAWKAAFQTQFSDAMTIVEWQTKVAERIQGPQETLHQYSFSKLRVLARSPVPLTDQHKIEYLLQGVKDIALATSISAQRPKAIDEFIEIATQLDNTLAHIKTRPTTSQLQTVSRSPTSVLPAGGATGRQTFPRTDGLQQPRHDFKRRITTLPEEEQEVRYTTITEKYGAPAFRRGQDIRDATCYKCKQKGHLAAHCPSQTTAAQRETKPQLPALPACHSHLLEGSQVMCPMVSAAIDGYGPLYAFPDSGSKMTIISDKIAEKREVIPWKGPALSVVGGGQVTPVGTTQIAVTIAGIKGIVWAAILCRNVLPFILGEEWFLAAQAELHVKPPYPSEIRHPASGTTVYCEERLVPQMLNAVILQSPGLSAFINSSVQSSGLRSNPVFADEKSHWTALECPKDKSQSQANSPAEPPAQPFLSDSTLGPQLTEPERSQLRQVIDQHANAFARNEHDLGYYTATQHEIQLVEGAQPYSRQSYHYSQDDRRYLEAETTRLLTTGIIERSASAWAFPAVVVTRNNKKRLCVNYIPLNRLTVPVAQPLPRAEDLMQDVSGCALFGTLDLKCAYWQIGLKKEDQHKTSFMTHNGTYQWTRMPFGLRNAPATFQKAMSNILENLEPRHPKCGVRVYLDDILFAQNVPEFLRLLREVLTLILRNGLKISPTKCCLAVTSIKFLGYIISGTGKSPDPAKVEVLLRTPAPTTTKAVLSWIQTAGFYRRFIPGFAKIVYPLQSIVRSGEYKWTEECEQAFQTIRKSLTSAPVLGHFDPKSPTTVATDASGIALGAVLSQQQQGKEVVLEYASRSLTQHEKHLHSNVLECLAVHWSVTLKFRSYLLTIKFCILTDNWTVACLTSSMKPSRRFTSMLMDLTEFDFTVQHRPGRMNAVADLLSRLSCATLTPTTLSQAQQADPELKQIMSDLQYSSESDSLFVVTEDILYRRMNSGSLAIVLPRSMRQAALELTHDGNGHMNHERTLAKVKARYWWPQMRATVKDYVTACHTCQFGTPDHVLTDHAKCFESKDFTNFLKHHGIVLHHSVAYRAASNGMVERSNATLVAVLRKLCQQHPHEWEKHVREAAFAINMSVNASMGFSPFQLLHGFTPKLPQQRVRPRDESTLEERLSQLSENRHTALATSEVASDARKDRYDRTHRPKEVSVGDIVWLQRQEPVLDMCTKLAPRFKGLYRVTEKKTPSTYKVTRLNTNSLRHTPDERVVHISQVKPYRPPYQDPLLFSQHDPSSHYRGSEPLADTAAGTPTPSCETLAPPEHGALEHHTPPENPAPVQPRRVIKIPRRFQDYELSSD